MKLLSLTVGNQTINPPPSLPKPGTESTIINGALTIFITAGIVLTVIFFVWGGIMWITSGGDKQKIASARARLTWSIVGLAVILISYFIVAVFGHFFGVQLLNVSF